MVRIFEHRLALLDGGEACMATASGMGAILDLSGIPKGGGSWGGVISFEIDGEKNSTWKFIDSTQFISQTANLGDTKSTTTYPAITTHGPLSPDDG